MRRPWWQVRIRALTLVVVVGALVSLTGPVTAAVTGRTTPGSGHSGHHAHHRHHYAHHRRHAVRVPPAFFGLHDSSQQAYGRVPFGSIRLWDAGVTWRDIEISPGVYDWHSLDTLVSAAQAHGVKVTLVLAMTPSFYSDAATLPPAQLSHYADYVRAVMTRYRHFNGRRGISAYQVWNEGNVSTFWTGTPYQLAELTRIVHSVARQVDPRATVVAPSFAMRLPYESRWFAHFQATRVAGRPVWRYYDANALSLYPMATYGERAGGPEDAMALVGLARRILTRAHVPTHKHLWASEINYGLVSGAAPGMGAAAPISQRQQVANVIRTYLLGAARGLSRVFWYRYDWGMVDGGTLGNTLLATPDAPDQVTPAGRAVATIRHWLHGRLVTLHGRRPCRSNREGTYQCVVHYAGGVRRIYWNPRREVRVQVGAAAAYRQTALGSVSAIGRSGAAIRVGYQPVMVDSRR